MHVANVCSNCDADVRSIRRNFTAQAWSVLLAWEEVSPEAVDLPICDDCYEELRDILIDRAVEVERMLAEPQSIRPPQAKPTSVTARATAAKAKPVAAAKTTAAKKSAPTPVAKAKKAADKKPAAAKKPASKTTATKKRRKVS